jgi:hypothetical protein
MFRITTETCNAFTFAELLILAAINVESMRPTPEGGHRKRNAAQKHTSSSRRRI